MEDTILYVTGGLTLEQRVTILHNKIMCGVTTESDAKELLLIIEESRDDPRVRTT